MKFKQEIGLFFILGCLIHSVFGEEQKQYKSGLRKEDFQKEIDGKKTDLFVLTNKNGCEVAVTNYGGAIAAIMVPDKNGKFLNVVHGHDSIDNILNSPKKHLSTLIGRFGNRIKDGKFVRFGLCNLLDTSLIPMPAWNLLPMEKYHEDNHKCE